MKLPVNYKQSLYARVSILQRKQVYNQQQVDKFLVRIERAENDKQLLAINRAFCKKEDRARKPKRFLRSVQKRANLMV